MNTSTQRNGITARAIDATLDAQGVVPEQRDR
jgi:hypothetical protein